MKTASINKRDSDDTDNYDDDDDDDDDDDAYDADDVVKAKPSVQSSVKLNY